jgi:hypothetical protein
MAFTPYLFFSGTCREAFERYRACWPRSARRATSSIRADRATSPFAWTTHQSIGCS